MKRIKRSLYPILGIMAISLTAFIGCQDGGVVGSSFLPANPGLSIDTTRTNPMTSESLVSYAGSKGLIAAGRYEDPLFGTIESVALLTPGLLGVTSAESFDYEGLQFGFSLVTTSVNGDTNSVVEFDIYEIQQRWRAQELRHDERLPLSPSPIGRFEMGLNDSIFVPLPDVWAQRYKSYYADYESSARDSAYVRNEFGFAFVPVSGNKISYINAARSSFIAFRPDTTDFLGGIRQRASYYDIVSPPVVDHGNSIVIDNDFLNVARISFRIDEELVGAKFVSRAELVLYEDRQKLDSTLGTGHIRRGNNTIRLYTLDEDEKEFYVTKEPILTALRSDSDRSYRINLTNLANNAIAEGGRDFVFYIQTDIDNGTIRPNLFVNDSDSPRAPKLIFTKINPTR